MSLAFNEPKFDIEASDFRCKPCGAEIPCEGAYYSAILLEEGSFRRWNYCGTCWKAALPAGEIFAFWRTRRPPLPSDKPRRVRFEPAVIFEFFRRLETPPPARSGDPEPVAPGAEAPRPGIADDPRERDELRFVLSLLLVRKKVLDFRSSVLKDGAEWLQLELRGLPAPSREEAVDPAAAGPAPAPPPARTHWVKNPQLTDGELERVKVRIADLLQLEV